MLYLSRICIILSRQQKTKALIRRTGLICAFGVRVWHKQIFSRRGLRLLPIQIFWHTFDECCRKQKYIINIHPPCHLQTGKTQSSWDIPYKIHLNGFIFPLFNFGNDLSDNKMMPPKVHVHESLDC